MAFEVPKTLEQWQAAGEGFLPGHLGIRFEVITPDEVIANMTVQDCVDSWHGFLHGGSVVSLADTCSGYGTLCGLPDGATSFTTVELKTNFLSTVRDGEVRCEARPLHKGRSTQIWDATVSAGEKALAHFRCTQMILWPK